MHAVEELTMEVNAGESANSPPCTVNPPHALLSFKQIHKPHPLNQQMNDITV
jgi:hypothetical protein